ncbi:hypothetical protein N431DRAFT_501086 [Stipitochalara longipes BDJ]|nr:hypothetical protein N431DRAFT_501086 [Stipitochalara longipes BDJ]
MAHIADFMVDTPSSAGLNNYIARELSPHSSHDAAPEVPPVDEKEKYVWRMHQPTEPRKYQLFPTKDKLSITAGQKNADAEQSQSQSTTMGQNGSSEKDRSLLGTALRLKPKEQTLIRRRKVSVPELGPMTTVQEIAMDSPTIPGRPPLHERSISAPGNSWRQHVFGESMLSCISGPALDESAEMAISADSANAPAEANIQQGSQQNSQSFSASSSSNARSASPKQPLSPKSLAPLVIPSPSQAQRIITRKPSGTRLRSGSNPPDVPPKSARMTENSPYSRASPYTPMSASSTSLLSASTAPTSMATTPNSALPLSIPEGRSSPKPAGSVTPTPPSAGPSPMVPGHSRGVSDAPQRQFPLSQSHHGHRRHESEGGASIMDRGRPKKRADGSPINRTLSKRSPSNPTSTAALVEEQKAFEHLPSGHPATTASSLLPASEVETLRKQAMGQASRFQVLNSKDVDALSRELRALDERCEYLRKTHRSLRSGRRNLHDRICTYLRSPRVAKFSHDSMLKQEEALSELDSSIDDWVSKLEQAENRRTRVRQKLLEHVAAALIMQPVEVDSHVNSGFGSRSVGEEKHVVQMALAMAIAPNGENTPPRSPTKGQSPERLERVVEEVKVTSPETRRGGRDVESIRIYADSDLSALLADVEEEINRMGEQGELHERERLDRERQEKERKTEDTIAAGITLNAVAFEGMLAHQRSLQNMRMQMPEFV